MAEEIATKITFEYEGEIRELTLPRDHFTIDPSEIDAELCRIGSRMLHYGELEGRLQAEVERKENRFKQWEAQMDTAIRQEAKATGEKITENGISSKINRSPERLKLLDSITESRRNHATAKAAHFALRSKRDCLISLAYREKELIKADRYSS